MDAHAAEGGHLPELFAKNLTGGLVEEALAVHDAGDAVIDRIARLGWDLDSGFTHTGQENRTFRISNLRSHFQPVPVTVSMVQGGQKGVSGCFGQCHKGSKSQKKSTEPTAAELLLGEVASQSESG